MQGRIDKVTELLENRQEVGLTDTPPWVQDAVKKVRGITGGRPVGKVDKFGSQYTVEFDRPNFGLNHFQMEKMVAVGKEVGRIGFSVTRGGFMLVISDTPH